jgi:hypothetical protein
MSQLKTGQTRLAYLQSANNIAANNITVCENRNDAIVRSPPVMPCC